MKIDYYKEIKARYGNIRRAKDYYLYTEKNVRLLDMYLDAGMSALGRRKNQSPLVFKQFVDKGLMGFLPTKADYNLEKALTTLFPEHSEFRIYNSDADCYDASKACSIAFDKSKGISTNLLWRAFLPESDELLEQDAFFVQPALCSVYKIFVFKRKACLGLDSSDGLNLPSSVLMPATEKAALARAFFDLAKKQAEYKKLAGLDDEDYLRRTSTKRQRRQAEASLRQYKQIRQLGAKFWDFKGLYLFPKMTEEEYKEFFFKALDAKILLSPDFSQPSFLAHIQNYTELLKFLKENT